MAQQDVNVKINIDTTQAQQNTVNVRERIRELMKLMTQLQLQGKENTQEYANAAKELGVLKDAISDTSAQARIMSDDLYTSKAALEGLAVGVNVFSGLTQAAALFGDEDSNLTKILVKLQAAQNLANTAMNIAKMLNKDTALMTALRSAATKKLTTEQQKNNAATTEGAAATTGYAAAEGVATTGAITLKGAIKAVGAAIKSVPVVGWILAAISALVTLISLVKDTNEEEDKGNDILEERKKKIQEINDNYLKTLQSIREENSELSKLMVNLANGSGQLYEDATKAVATFVGVSEDYIKSLSTAEAENLKNIVLNYKETSAAVQKLKQELDEGLYEAGTEAFQKAQQELWAGQKAIASYEKTINSEREKGYKWVKDTAEATKRLEEIEKERQKRIENNTKELEDLQKVLYPQSDEEAITEEYDHLLDLAIKYYGEESQQVEELTRLRLEALEKLSLAKKEAEEKNLKEQEEARQAEEEATRIAQEKAEQIRLEIIKDSTEEGTEARLNAQKELNNYLMELELQQADFEIQNTELLEQTKAQIRQKYASENLKAEQEYNTAVLNAYSDRVEMMSSIASNFSGLVSQLQEVELEEAEGNEKKQAEIKKKYAKMTFLSQVASIGIDTAKGIMSVWSTAGQLGPIAGPIAGAIQTAIIAATGMAQTAAAQTAMNKALRGYAAKGAFVTGRSHAQGGELYEVENGEMILNKNVSRIPAFKALASSMNEATGGVAFTNTSSGATLTATIDENTLNAIVQRVAAIPVVVTERDITQAQRNVSIVNNRSRF